MVSFSLCVHVFMCSCVHVERQKQETAPEACNSSLNIDKCFVNLTMSVRLPLDSDSED